MQQQKILKKIVEELNKEKPDLSYLRGLAESLIDDSTQLAPYGSSPILHNHAGTTPTFTFSDTPVPVPNLKNIDYSAISST